MDAMSCARESLLTKVTWLPLVIVMFCGLTALFEIVIVVVAVVGPVGAVGELVLPELPAQAPIRIAVAPAAARPQVNFLLTDVMLISPPCVQG